MPMPSGTHIGAWHKNLNATKPSARPTLATIGFTTTTRRLFFTWDDIEVSEEEFRRSMGTEPLALVDQALAEMIDTLAGVTSYLASAIIGRWPFGNRTSWSLRLRQFE